MFEALLIQHEKCKAQSVCSILPSVACPALQYVSEFSHKRQDFRKKKNIIEHEVCVSIFSTNLSEASHSKNN